MNSALQSSLSTNPFVKGILYADINGLCISAVGELEPKHSGRYSSISRTAGSLNQDCPPPVVLIETRDRHILVKDYDSNTIVLKCVPTEG
mmetsp:Transcript_1930/g.3064  ORF Transcript_1930/g.3064 Transcript_1930/m.3064 type:complete len:90 (-) Transcript_1930:172-441(-)|eukprot:CAMPEP_0185017762 /NCGR_PEP_ID=MMETSP1103-20130426/669_1 /TAXON_ID=36769 /ORGANISM="Paraphysomonas bandaiensis, Strain Caron Lab Isolate" /LENGTH=89 /DNA_ID=CAMNT_0027547329 /DNA_START=36 /DNA_END=305 /DNA_ORIENTATION=+